MPDPLVVSPKEMAKLLDISVRTFQRINKNQGPIPSMLVGCRLKYEPQIVLAWFAARPSLLSEHQSSPVIQPKRKAKRVSREPDLSCVWVGR